MIDRNTNAQLTTEALPFAKPLLWAVRYLTTNFKNGSK
jgi:hypothetical protein